MLKTLKRKIALVAVSVLGASGLAVVAAPAANAVSTVTAISASTAFLRTAVGGQITIAVTGAETNTDARIRARVLDAPVGVAAGCAITTVHSSAKGAIATGDERAITLPASCDKDGNYRFLVWIDGNGAENVAAADEGGDTAPASASIRTAVVNITTSGAPTSIALDKTAYTGANTVDILGEVTLKDANGRLTKLAVGDFLTLSITAGSLGVVNGDFHPSTATTVLTTAGSLASANDTTALLSDGNYPIAVKAAAAGSGTITVGAAGSIASIPAVTATLTTATPTFAVLSKVTSTSGMANSADLATVGTLASAATPDGVFAAAGEVDNNDGATVTRRIIVSTAQPTVTFSVGAGTNVSTALTGIRVLARTGVTLPAGITADTADRAVTTSATTSTTAFTGTTNATATITLTSTAPLAGTGYDVRILNDANDGILYSVVYASPNVSATTGTVTLSPDAAKAAKATIAGSATVTATVKDQFGAAFVGANTIWTLTGRNAQTRTIATDASGIATLTYSDTSTSTTAFTDTIAVKAAAPTSSTFADAANTTITWATAAALAVATVVVAPVAHVDLATSGGSFTTTAMGILVDSANLSYTATVRDALGSGIVGVPVVFTADSGAAVATTGAKTATVYTTTGGVATWAVRPIGGLVKISAAVGGKSGDNSSVTGITNGSGNIAANVFTAGAAGDKTASRVLAMQNATASLSAGSATRLSATVKDRYGNLVPNQNVLFTITGAVGRFGGGALTVTSPTDASGVAVADFVSLAGEAGSATVTATLTAANVDNSTATTTAVGGAYPAAVTSSATAVTITAATAAANPALDAVKSDVKAVSDTVATLSKAVTTIQSSVTELTSSFSAQIKSLSSAIAKISRAIAALSKRIR